MSHVSSRGIAINSLPLSEERLRLLGYKTPLNVHVTFLDYDLRCIRGATVKDIISQLACLDE